MVSYSFPLTERMGTGQRRLNLVGIVDGRYHSPPLFLGRKTLGPLNHQSE